MTATATDLAEKNVKAILEWLAMAIGRGKARWRQTRCEGYESTGSWDLGS